MQKYSEQLEEQGYCLIPKVYPPEQVARALELVTTWHEQTRDRIGQNLSRLFRDQATVFNLQNKDLFFIRMLLEPTMVSDLMRQCLNDQWYTQIPASDANYILRVFSARSSQGALPLHIDSFIPYQGRFPLAMQVSVALEDQTATNGGAIVVPGSHQWGEFADPQRLAEAISLEAKAGDVIIWDGRLWHGTTANTTTGTRWSLIATFERWWMKQHFNITKNLPGPIFDALSLSEKAILGYCSIPMDDETDGADLKHGYGAIQDSVEDYR
ncbi:MAG: phytanoyl-CoA dioxygenase family protein [Candidatus Sericytochromatia bacterium]|nr:phytanoyl-CoA dioxygenase family protein [Candidatus Sericytochromatia bacterium]